MEERFWSKVKRGTDDECWEWLGGKDKDDYGYFKTKQKMKKAHRIVYELTHSKIPEGLVVRHKCRGKCVNPSHLEVGTIAENCADMIRDGTLLRGEKNGFARLTEDQVRDIKARLRDYERGMVKSLADEYGVAYQTIYGIKSGKNWSWVTCASSPP